MRQVLGRLARFLRCTSPEGLRHRERSARLRCVSSRSKRCVKKRIGPAATIAQAAAEWIRAQAQNPNTRAALSSLVAAHGHQLPSQLTAEHLQIVVGAWRGQYAQHTRSTYTKCLRRFIRWLERIAGAPPTLSDAVPKVHQPQPRTTIATDEDRRLLLAAATPGFRFFILLCADLGLRHRTAARICLANYNPHLRALSFTTKGNVRQTLPVTAEIADIIEALPRNADRYAPIVNLLRTAKPGHTPGLSPRFTKQWKALKRRTNTRPELRIHDLRRTLAEDVWTATHDIRAVQAQLGHRSPTTTARYLADRIGLQDLQPIMRKVQQLRAVREAERPQPQVPMACETCSISTFCNPEARLCERKEHDA